MPTVNIEQIALSVVGMMKEGTDMERSIQEVAERLDIELTDEQKDLVRDRVNQHMESQKQAEEETTTTLNTDANSTTTETNTGE